MGAAPPVYRKPLSWPHLEGGSLIEAVAISQDLSDTQGFSKR